MTELEALEEALEAVQRRIRTAEGVLKPPWTAIASMTRLEADLLQRRAVLSHAAADVAPLDGEEIRAGILALPDELVDVAAEAVEERRAAGGPVLVD